MAITSAQAVERALRQLSKEIGREQATRYRSVLSVIAQDALELMAIRIKDGDGYEGLQQDFTATPTAGRLDLTTIPGALFDIDKSRVRISSSNVTVQSIDSIETLEHGNLALDRNYVAQDGQELIFRSVTTGLLTDFATAIKIKTNYIPSFVAADSRPIPFRHEGTLVSTMIELALKAEMPAVVVGEARESAAIGRT
jgi:hypothetical protein